MKEWNFFDKVYRVWLVVLVGPPDEFLAFLKKQGYKDIDELHPESASGYLIRLRANNTETGSLCDIIWMKEWHASVLVHELVHFVGFVFTDKEVPLDIETTEAFAYYQEFWFTEINRARKRWPDGRSPAECRRDRYK